MIRGIVILNALVFFLWSFSGETQAEWMAQNFLVSWDALTAGRWWVLITSVFSHIQLFHILINMMVLQNFGGLLLRVMGRNSFLKFYLTAGVVASLAHAAVSAFIMGDSSIPALGASGAIAGCVMIFCFMFPREKIYLLGFVPVPAIFGALAFIGLDLWGLVAQAQGGGLPIGHGAHLGGAFTGIAWYYLVTRKRLRRAPT